MQKRSLLLGCGHDRRKKVALSSHRDWAGALTTLDMNPGVGADIVWDLDSRPLPFDDETFCEIGAYDVLEHVGRQGDWRGWFEEMAEYHRILAPGGEFGIIVPVGRDALADPGHTRFFSLNYFGFLNQALYEPSLAKGEPITDYRFAWKGNFETVAHEECSHHLSVLLRKTAGDKAIKRCA